MTDHTLVELMEDLQFQTELHDKHKLEERRELAKRDKEHALELKLKRKKPRRVTETPEEKRIRKYKQFEEA